MSEELYGYWEVIAPYRYYVERRNALYCVCDESNDEVIATYISEKEAQQECNKLNKKGQSNGI